QAFRAALAGAPNSGAAVDAARLLSGLSGLTPADRLAIGTVYERNGNASRAAAGFRAWLAANLGTPAERADVRLRLGRALFNAGSHAEAEAALRPLAADPGLGGEALYWTGRAQYRRGSRAAAIETLASAGRFRTAGAADALYLAADLTQDAGNGARARALYRRVADEHPGSPKAGLALMRLGGMAFTAGDHAGAARLYDEYRGRYPQGDQWLQASYWSGRAHATRGDANTARERWRGVREREPASYYAVLSARRLREPFWPVKTEAAPADDPRALDRVAGWLRGIDLLRAAGLYDEATAEAERRIREAGDDRALLYPLAEALGERGLPSQAIALGRRLQRGPGVYDMRLLRILNPFPYRALIAAEARERGLDPFLVAALIRQESSFRPRVVSRAGAMGLMQVMPATGAGLASAAGIRGWERDLLLNPEINVHLGTRFLAAQMRAYDGSLPSVFSAYNAGPGRVRQWRNFPEYRDPELFTERIPIDETRDYVKILTRNIELYRGLYGG
ncbi:MAG TPA: transglycosylase SLT domain-containing protein, partial [Longimicrobium sp.]|nr:transglycosylase SLT domain-containing protein [Longimicrobium sp.]